jgi:hypothetical protein
LENIEVAKIKVGQSVTLEFGNMEPILTKLEEPRKFKMEDWYEEEREIYILEEVITEDEPLHFSFEPFDSLKAGLKANGSVKFGQDLKVLDFLNRVVDSIEMEEEEEAEAEG